jgi:hypothetical protein
MSPTVRNAKYNIDYPFDQFIDELSDDLTFQCWQTAPAIMEEFSEFRLGG